MNALSRFAAQSSVLAAVLVACLVACLIAMSAPAAAQSPPGAEQLRPYLQVKPVAGDEATIRAFFSPACAYSKRYFQFFKNLEKTLPPDKTFRFTALANRGDGLAYELAFLAVQQYYPQHMDDFVEASLIGVQEKNWSPRDWATIERIGRAARIPVSLPALVRDHAQELRSLLASALDRQKALEITNTPAVAVAGTYVVTPEFTSGDMNVFSQLVNGIISMP